MLFYVNRFDCILSDNRGTHTFIKKKTKISAAYFKTVNFPTEYRHLSQMLVKNHNGLLNNLSSYSAPDFTYYHYSYNFYT